MLLMEHLGIYNTQGLINVAHAKVAKQSQEHPHLNALVAMELDFKH